MSSPIDPLALLRPRRKILGLSAILLPFTPAGAIDWPGFSAHVLRTAEAGLTPAVNMDTGFVNLLDDDQRQAVLGRTREVLGSSPFVAGAFVADHPAERFARDAYLRQIETIHQVGATPVIFQSFGLTRLADDDLIAAYEALARHCDRFIGFELSTLFAPFGRVYSLEVYRRLLGLRACIGAKHSSLKRDLEWQRLILRDQVRPDFHVFTGNDLAIDMVMYGSDYLLGLSTFAPDLFARRDRFWETGDPAFFELNDVLQYLGFLAFRTPVPAYKHSAAQFLKSRGWIDHDGTHPGSPTRPDSDRELLADIARQLDLPCPGGKKRVN
jgi:dihydrodipicolinate synthase/N-acetylneuraminate lyase